MFLAIYRDKKVNKHATVIDLLLRAGEELNRYKRISQGLTYVVATAAKIEGRMMIKKFEFEKVVSGEDRRDNYDLYKRDISEIEDFEEFILSKIGPLSLRRILKRHQD